MALFGKKKQAQDNPEYYEGEYQADYPLDEQGQPYAEGEYDYDEGYDDYEEEVLEFKQVKRGFDPEQVQDYIHQLIDAHEEELETVVDRLREAQEEKDKLEKIAAQQIEQLEQARDH